MILNSGEANEKQRQHKRLVCTSLSDVLGARFKGTNTEIHRGRRTFQEEEEEEEEKIGRIKLNIKHWQ